MPIAGAALARHGAGQDQRRDRPARPSRARRRWRDGSMMSAGPATRCTGGERARRSAVGPPELRRRTGSGEGALSTRDRSPSPPGSRCAVPLPVPGEDPPPTASTIAVSTTGALGGEAEPGPVASLELRLHRLGPRPRPRARCRCLRSAKRRGGGSQASLDAAAEERRARLAASSASTRSSAGAAPGALAQLDHVGEAHAVGAEHAGERVDHHPLHAERVGDQAGVLAAGAAEALQACSG